MSAKVIRLDRRATTEAEYYRPFDEQVNRQLAAMAPAIAELRRQNAREEAIMRRRVNLRRPPRPRGRKCEHAAQIELFAAGTVKGGRSS